MKQNNNLSDGLLCRFKILCIPLIVGLVLIVVGQFDVSFATMYSNYTSDKNHIQFQFPAEWKIKEKMNRFDEGPDVQVVSPTPKDGFMTLNVLDSNFSQGVDIKTATDNVLEGSITMNNSPEDYRVIEYPSFIKISKEAGTYLYTRKDKIGDTTIEMANQVWTIKTPNAGYILDFSATTDVFDSPAVTDVRDHLIKSIKFLGLDNAFSTRSAEETIKTRSFTSM